MCKICGPPSFIFSEDVFLQVSELGMPFLQILLQKAKHILNQKHGIHCLFIWVWKKTCGFGFLTFIIKIF